MQLMSSEFKTEVIDGLARWQFLPYRGIFPSVKACATSFANQFPNFRTEFVDDGSTWFLSNEPPGNRRWFGAFRFLSLETEILKKRMARLELFFSPHGKDVSDTDAFEGSRLLNKVHDEAQQKGITHISCSAYAGDSITTSVLENAGYRLKDSIVSYHLPLVPDLLSRVSPLESAIQDANEDDITALSRIAFKCFSDRSLNINRFNSDRQFASLAVGDLYGKFVENAVINKKDNFVLSYKHDGKPVGFMTFQWDKPQEDKSIPGLGKAVLSAVDPDFQGKGIYRKLLLEGCLRLAERGMTRIEGKTQLSTYRVIHIWQTLGAEMRFAYHTFHLDNLLS